MKRWIIILLVLSVGGIGCSNSEKPEEPENPQVLPTRINLIGTYIDPQQVTCVDFIDYRQLGFVQGQVLPYNVVLWLFCDLTKEEDYITDHSHRERFDSLVQAHGDDHWNYWSQPIGACLFRETTGVHVVCDRDYDREHPAGTLLDDLVLVHYETLDHTLVGGEYLVDVTDPQNVNNNNWLGYKFEAPLSSFNQERHKLIPLRFECRLTKAPAETGEYVFTCTWTNEDGKKLTTSTDPLRIQGER